MAATDRSEGSEPTRTASSSMLGKRKHSSQTGVFCLHLEMWNHEVGQDIGRKYAVMLPVEATMLRMAERASANRRLHPLSQNGMDYSGTDSAREPGALPAENRTGWGRYPFRVRRWYFFRCSPTSFTVTLRQPRFGFACG